MNAKPFKELHGHADMKLKKIFSHAPDVDAIVLLNAEEPFVDLSFFYVTGLTSGLFEGCAAILTPENVKILTSSLEEESARKSGLEVRVFATRGEGDNLLKETLKDFKKIGVNSQGLTYSSFQKLKKVSEAEFIDVSKAISRARLIKDEEEISRIRKACTIISGVAEGIPNLVREGMTELELAAELNYSMQKKGASQPAFPTLVCFGRNASEPHHSSGDTPLRRGDFILCDMGAQYRRYVSDITRTFLFREADPEKVKMYEKVLESQKKALSMLKEGVQARDVHLKVKEILDKAYENRFIHGLGHTIGLSVHDGERMNIESEFTMEENMVFTVEPGVYIPGFGGVRIEDDVVIKKGGVDILTTAGKELQVI